MTVKILKAGNGDAILLNYPINENETKNILIDFGNRKEEYVNHLRQELLTIKNSGQKIDLAIATHMDEDHISGFEFLYEDFEKNEDLSNDLINKYWFNTFSSVKEVFGISARQVNLLQDFLKDEPDTKWSTKEIIQQSLNPMTDFGAKITILSPNIKALKRFNNKYNTEIAGKKLEDDYKYTFDELWIKEEEKRKNKKINLDYGLENATSIAFLLEHEGLKFLFLGDAIPRIIDDALREYLKHEKLDKLKVDFVKLSHHASRKSLSLKFLELVEAENFIISTDGLKHKHPNKSTLAKILLHPKRDKSKSVNFIFNYKSVAESVLKNKECSISLEDEMKKHNFTYEYENYEHGYQFTK